MTMLLYVYAADNALTPLLISGITVKDTIWEKDLRPNEDIIISIRYPSYIDEYLFHSYIKDNFILHVIIVRNKLDIHEEQVVSMHDLYKTHSSIRFFDFL